MLRAHQIVALCVMALLSIGVVMVNSASFEVVAKPAKATPAATSAMTGAPDAAKPLPALAEPAATLEAVGPTPTPKAREVSLTSLLTSQHAIFMAVALLAMGAASLFPLRRIAERLVRSDEVPVLTHDRRWAGVGTLAVGTMVIVGLLALVYLSGIGKAAKGSERWLRIPAPGLGQVSVQPSEIAKWGLVLLLAYFAARRAAVMSLFWRGLAPALIAMGLVTAVVIKEDLGTGALIGAAATIVLLAGGARIWHFAALSPLACGAIYFAIAGSEYRMRRITAFMHPYADPQGTGYHPIQSMGAVAGGGILGRGLGHGIQKFGYLPEDTNDFIFAIICEELGAPGAALVIGLFAILIWSAFAIIAREHNRMLKLFGLGVVSTVGLQALINLAVVTALGPTKGIALPLISAGGTGWTLTAVSLGLLISIGRTQGQSVLIPLTPWRTPLRASEPVEVLIPTDAKRAVVG